VREREREREWVRDAAAFSGGSCSLFHCSLYS
jgi:hypothetical protein